MPTLPVWCGVLAALAFRGTGHPRLTGISLIIAGVGFLSYKIMQHGALIAAGRRRQLRVTQMELEGAPAAELSSIESAPLQLSIDDVQSAPNWATYINVVATIVTLFLLVAAIIMRLR